MAIETTCPHCRKSFRLKSDNAVGRKVRCPGCSQHFVIQAKVEAPAPASPQPFAGEPITSDDSPYALSDLNAAAAAEQKSAPNPYAPPPISQPLKISPFTAKPVRSKTSEQSSGSSNRIAVICLRVIGAILFIIVVRVSVRLIFWYIRDPEGFSARVKNITAPNDNNAKKEQPTARYDPPAVTPPPAPIVSNFPARQQISPKDDASILPLKSTPEQDAKLEAIVSNWKTAGGYDLLSSLQGGPKQMENGVMILPRWQRYSTTERFVPPVTFKAIVMNYNRDFRFGYAADEIIFNWEMRQDEFRVGGGPASGRHKPGAGRLPVGVWVGIEWVVKPDEMIVYVDGEERYRTQADFSRINKPLTVWSQNGVSALRELKVVK